MRKQAFQQAFFQMNRFNLLVHFPRLVVDSLILSLRLLSLIVQGKPRAGGDAVSDNLMLLYSQVPWSGVWQRPQEMAMGFSENRPVLFVSPVQIHEKGLRYKNWKRALRVETGARDLSVLSPLIFSGEYRWAFVAKVNRALMQMEIAHALGGQQPATFLTNTPLGAHLLDGHDFKQVVYDVMDDWAAFDWAPSDAMKMEQRLLKDAQVVFTGTNTLQEKICERRPDARFHACGVHYQRFAKPQRGETSQAEIVPDDIRDLPRPLIGYVGTLSERIDPDILLAIAKRLPDASVVLIGPVYRTLGPRPQAPNIHYFGLKPHDTLPAYMHQFAVALLPFRLTQAAMAINPVKALEYLAAQCVMVSTRIPDMLRFYKDIYLFADTPEEFAEQVAEVLETDNTQRIESGRQLAEDSSWERMVLDMEKQMSGA